MDKLAKIACGVEISNKDQLFIDSISDVNGYPDEIPPLQIINWTDYKEVLV